MDKDGNVLAENVDYTAPTESVKAEITPMPVRFQPESNIIIQWSEEYSN